VCLAHRPFEDVSAVVDRIRVLAGRVLL
jgi:hypothetical protein